MIDKIIPLIAFAALIATFIYSLCVAVKVAEDTYPRRVYIVVLVIWIIVIGFFAYRQITFADSGREVDGYLYCNVIAMGTFCQLSLLAYAISVLFYTKINLKSVLLFLFPAVIVVGANVVWNLCNGISWFDYYPSLDALMADFFSVTVMLRISMLVIQAFYVIGLYYCAKSIVPIYNKYLSNNQANEEYNLYWIYSYMFGYSLIMFVYFIVALAPNAWTMTLYCLVAIYAFIILTGCVWEYKSFPKFYEVNLQWSLKEGWSAKFADNSRDILELEEKPSENINVEDIEDVVDDLRLHIITTKLYSRIDLSIKEVLADYNHPQLTSGVLIDQLSQHGYTFQTFIREIRIERAVAIKSDMHNNILYKDIFPQVGFSHYSSFARAFTIVKGVSPSQYKHE